MGPLTPRGLGEDTADVHSTGKPSEATRARCSQDSEVDPVNANPKQSVQPKRSSSETLSRFWQIWNGLACMPGGKAHSTGELAIHGTPPVEMLQGKLRHKVQP